MTPLEPADVKELVDNGVEVIVLLSAMCALSERDPGGDQMRATQRFGDVAIDRELIDEHLGIAERKPLALNKKPREGFHRPSPLDQALPQGPARRAHAGWHSSQAV